MSIIVFRSDRKKHHTAEMSLPEQLTRRNQFTRFACQISRKLHLDKYFWYFILLLIISTPLYKAYESETAADPVPGNNLEQLDPKIGTDDWLAVAALFGAAGGLLLSANGIHNQYHHNKLLRASKYIESWCSEDFEKKIQPVLNLADSELEKIYEGKPASIEEGDLETPILRLKYSGYKPLLRKLSTAQTKIAKVVLNDQEKQKQAKNLFAFFEHMGMDVKLGLADEEYLKNFFYAVVIRYYELFRKYIEYWQHKRDSRGVYCNFVFLAQSWEKENDPPELPRICQRETILSPEDLE